MDDGDDYGDPIPADDRLPSAAEMAGLAVVLLAFCGVALIALLLSGGIRF